ncbi:MAG: type II toxin-antitoxin system RelE/ParE family toxin, partial [Acidobacteriota bacterium]|nr:type II toxin-antitoxin system RelE/ParE family toxin [Acidobacteriota bacterium]
MAYRVNLTDRANRDLDNLYGFIDATESVAAARWFSRLEDMIDSLATAPRMGKVTHEDKDVREVIYGNKPLSVTGTGNFASSKQQSPQKSPSGSVVETFCNQRESKDQQKIDDPGHRSMDKHI